MRLTFRLAALTTAALLSVGVALGSGSPAAAGEGQTTAGRAADGAALRIMPLGDSITFGKGDPTENGTGRACSAG